MLSNTFMMTKELLMNYTFIVCGISALIGFIAGRMPSRWFKKQKKSPEMEG